MAVNLLQVLVLGVIAAAADDDVPLTWVPSRASLPCQVPDAERIASRRPPPLLEGDEATRPRPNLYLWRRGDEELKRNSNGTLKVSRGKDPEGIYQCAVRHQGGQVLGYPLNVKFAYIEKSSVHLANSTAWRGFPFVLTCNVSSAPPAFVSWLRDGQSLPDDSRYHILNNQLLITDIKDEDAGIYRCRATNPYVNKSRIIHGARLEVEDGPENMQAQFLQMPHESSIVVPRGSRVVLPCPVLGSPKPQFIWEQTWRDAGAPREVTGELENTKEVLIIPRIEPDQEGLYVCRVEGNSDLVKRFNVTITSPVIITHPPESKQSRRISTVRFNCSATGKPTPKVTWYKDGKELKLTGRIRVVPSADEQKLPQLLIRSVTSEDAGVYQCFARNIVSVQSAWATLSVIGVEKTAPAPESLRCWPEGANKFYLRWTPVPADVLVYTVQFTQKPDGATLPWEPVTDTEVKITVESPLTPYSFQVQAYIHSPTGKENAVGAISGFSESVTCQGQGVPIKLSKVGDDAILVSWRKFFEQYPGVRQWILQYSAENGTDEHNVTLERYIYNYTLQLSPIEPLQVRVLGTMVLPWLHQNLTRVPWTSSSAAGHYSSTGQVPAIPEDVEVTELNARNFTVRWRCDAGVIPKSYSFLVCTRRLGGNEACLETYEKSAQVMDLLPNSEYEVKVQARLPGQVLGGDFSDPIAISTPSEGQQNFKELTYKYINATTVRVSWSSKPEDYTVRWSYEYDLPLNQWTTVDTIGNTVLLTGLDPTKMLFVKVEGLRPVGHSPLLTVPAQIPEAKNLQYSYNKNGVTVSWRGRGPRVVRYSQNLTQPLDLWPTLDVNHTSVQIDGLDPALTTFVMVAAPGPSQRSQVLTIKPRPIENSDSNFNLHLGIIIGIVCGVLSLALLAVVAVYIWRMRKRAMSPIRSRRRHSSAKEETAEEGSEMRNIGGRLANGGRSKDAGEPLLNGHVHITENPSQSKSPNGKVCKGRDFDAVFDVTRYDDADTTLETVLEPDTSFTAYNPLDTSRTPDTHSRDTSAYDSFNKLPDDNMNSELTRSTDFQLDNSKVLPTLQPNG